MPLASDRLRSGHVLFINQPKPCFVFSRCFRPIIGGITSHLSQRPPILNDSDPLRSVAAFRIETEGIMDDQIHDHVVMNACTRSQAQVRLKVLPAEHRSAVAVGYVLNQHMQVIFDGGLQRCPLLTSKRSALPIDFYVNRFLSDTRLRSGLSGSLVGEGSPLLGQVALCTRNDGSRGKYSHLHGMAPRIIVSLTAGPNIQQSLLSP